MAEISWTKKARVDLQVIHEFISEDSVFYANRFILKLISLVDVLENFPTGGRIVPEYEDSSIRELIEGNYRIFYKIGKSNRIYILRIHHAARKIS
jgi:plasmid stabilization system protein ParE